MDYSFDFGWGDSSGGGWFGSIYDAGASVFGAIGSAANALGGWAKDNPGGALILGSGISATGQYISGRAADKAAAKREKDAFNRESKRYNELHQTVNTDFGDPIMDPGSLAGNAPLTTDGLLSSMQNNPVDYNQKKLGV